MLVEAMLDANALELLVQRLLSLDEKVGDEGAPWLGHRALGAEPGGGNGS